MSFTNEKLGKFVFRSLQMEFVALHEFTVEAHPKDMNLQLLKPPNYITHGFAFSFCRTMKGGRNEAWHDQTFRCGEEG